MKKQAVAVRAVLSKVNQTSLSDVKVVAVYRDRLDFLKMSPVCPNPFPPFLVQMFYRTRVSNVKAHEEFWSLVSTPRFQSEGVDENIPEERLKLVGGRLASCLAQAPDLDKARESVLACLRAGPLDVVKSGFEDDEELCTLHMPRLYVMTSLGKGMKLSIQDRQAKLKAAAATAEANPLLKWVREFPHGRKILQQSVSLGTRLEEEADKFDEIKILLDGALSPALWVSVQDKMHLLHASHKVSVGEVITSQKLTDLMSVMINAFCKAHADLSLIPAALDDLATCQKLSALHQLHEVSKDYCEVYTELMDMLSFRKDFAEYEPGKLEMTENMAVKMHTALMSFEKDKQQHVLSLVEHAEGAHAAQQIKIFYEQAKETPQSASLEQLSKESISGTLASMNEIIKGVFSSSLDIDFNNSQALQAMAAIPSLSDVPHSLSVLRDLHGPNIQKELHELEYFAAALQTIQAAAKSAVQRSTLGKKDIEKKRQTKNCLD